MNPTLLPDLPHLACPLLVGVAALLAVGIGVLAGARRAEVALVAGLGLAVFATTIVGTLTPLRLAPVMAGLGILGVLGWVRAGVAARRGGPALELAMAGRVLALALPMLLMIEGLDTTTWDDFSHWLPNLFHLAATGRFPSLADPAVWSDHPAYPYGTALPGYAVYLLSGRTPETAGVFANVLLTLAACAVLAGLLERRIAAAAPASRPVARGWAAAALGLLLGGLASPSFVAKTVFSNMSDPASAAVLVVLALLLRDWFATDDIRDQRRIAVLFALASGALIGQRQTNLVLLLLLLIGAALAALLQRRRLGRDNAVALAIALLPPLVLRSLWTAYSNREIPGGDFSVLPYAEWHWATFGETLSSILHVLLTKGGLSGLLLVVTLRTGWLLARRGRAVTPDLAMALAVVVLAIGNIGFLAFAYLVSFSPPEAATAASFWRYFGQAGTAVMLAALAILPLEWLRWPTWRPAPALLMAAALLAPLASERLLRFDFESPLPGLRRQAAEMDRVVPPKASLMLLDSTGNGYSTLVVAYELTVDAQNRGSVPRGFAQEADPFGLPPARIGAAVAQHPAYLWISEGEPVVEGLVGLKLQWGCSYLLQATGTGWSVLRSWAIGPDQWGGYRQRPAEAKTAVCS